MDLHEPEQLRTVLGYLDDVFRYHAPEPDQLPRYEALRASAKAFARTIVENTPKCADQAAALRKVREAVMTANAAVALKGAVVLLVALLLPAPAAADTGDQVPGVSFRAIASGEVTLGGEASPSVRPAADLEVEGPLALGRHAPLRVSTELRIFGQVGETVDLRKVETFRALEVTVGLSRRIGRLQLGDQDVWTSIHAFCGFSSLSGQDPAPLERYPRRCAFGARIEERTVGARLDIAYGRDESAGDAGFGQVIVRGRLPVPATRGALVIGGDAVLSIDSPYRRERQRDTARLWVGTDLPALFAVFR